MAMLQMWGQQYLHIPPDSATADRNILFVAYFDDSQEVTVLNDNAKGQPDTDGLDTNGRISV